MRFKIADLCHFYLNITDPKDIKAFKLSNQVRKLNFLKEKERERVLEAWECSALESALVEHRGTMSSKRS